MNYSENAKAYYRRHIATLHPHFEMMVDCTKDSDTYKAIEEIRDAGLISVEDGQVVDDNGNKLRDLICVTNLCNEFDKDGNNVVDLFGIVDDNGKEIPYLVAVAELTNYAVGKSLTVSS
jgi:hypothetical protein